MGGGGVIALAWELGRRLTGRYSLFLPRQPRLHDRGGVPEPIEPN